MNTQIKTMIDQVNAMTAKVEAVNRKLENRPNLAEKAAAKLRKIMQSGQPVQTARKVDIVDALRSLRA